MARDRVLTAILAVVPACNAPGAYACSSDGACRSGDEVGWCELEGFCSFPDAACPSGRRFGELAAAPYAGECVDAVPMVASETSGVPPEDPEPGADGSSGNDDPARGEATGEASSDASSSDDAGEETGNEGELAFRNIVFVTSQTVVPAELGGLAGADAVCDALAAEAGLPGEYVAWLSTVGMPARERLEGASGWVNTRGEPFAASLDDLLAMEQLFPIRYDETGSDRVDTLVATATTSAGELDTTAGASDCNGWTEAVGEVRTGRTGGLGRSWTSSWQSGCTTTRSILCFGVDDAVEFVHAPAIPQRVAFVTDGVLPGTAGREGFDALCMAEAEAAGLAAPSSFVALVSTSQETAVSRLVLDGPGWSLVNGVPVVDAAADLGEPDAILRAPIFRTADGTPLGGPTVWSGAALATDLATHESCADWTSAVGAAAVGNSSRTIDWFRFSTAACSEARRVLCLQAAVG